MYTALESFIDYCDYMTISNESATSIEKKYKKLQQELEVINEKIEDEAENGANIDTIIKLLEKEKALIKQVKNEISSESAVGFIDTFRFIKAVIKPLIYGTILHFSKSVAMKTVFGTDTGFSTLGATVNIADTITKKKTCMDYMDKAIKRFDEYIAKLKDLKAKGCTSMNDIKDYLDE